MIIFQCYAYQIDSSFLGTCFHQHFGQRRIAYIGTGRTIIYRHGNSKKNVSGPAELSLLDKIFHLPTNICHTTPSKHLENTTVHQHFTLPFTKLSRYLSLQSYKMKFFTVLKLPVQLFGPESIVEVS